MGSIIAETSTYNAAEATCAITVLATETATLATSVGTGKYLLVVENDSKLMSAYAPETTKNYYYLNVNEAAIVGDKLYAAVGGAFTFTKQDDGNFTIQDIDGNYIYADANYNNFSFSSEVPENNLWSVEIASDGSATISNVATGQYALYSVTYSSIGCYSSEKAVAGDPLPKLYALDSTTTALRPAAEAASALSSEAYNILGQRVASDAKGLVIKGGKLSIRK